MIHEDPKKRSPLSKVEQVLKLKESESRLFDQKLLDLHVNTNTGVRIK